MSQEQAANTLNDSDRVWVQNLDARVGFKKSAEYAPGAYSALLRYGPLYMYFVAICVEKYAKFGWRLAHRDRQICPVVARPSRKWLLVY